MVCSQCGLVLESYAIDETSEWRAFANESRDNDPVRVGGPINPLLADSGGLSTVISKSNGDFLQRWQNQVSNQDRSLILAFKTIDTMCNMLSLVDTIKNRANEIYKKVEDQKSSRGRNRDSILAAAVIYIVTQLSDDKKSLKDVFDATEVAQGTIRNCYKDLYPHLGGLLFGPSFLGHSDLLGSTFFPARGTNMFETAAMFGLLFYLFLSAVKGDASMMLRPERAAIIIGGSVFLTSICPTLPLAIILQKYIAMQPSLSNSVPLIALAQCLIPFPSISFVLTELKILNSELGKLAMSACMFCNMLGLLVTAIGFAVLSGKTATDSVLAVVSIFALVFGCAYIVRPIVTEHILRCAQQGDLREVHIVVIFLLVMLSGLFSEFIGQHIVLGPLVFGLTFPDGLPLGSVVVEKLYYPIVKIFYPIYLTASGLKTDIFTISWQPLWVIGSIFAFSIFVKIGTLLLVACFVNLSVRDAVIVGIMFNSKGIMDLVMFNLYVDTESLTREEFALSVMMMILITGTVAPLLRHMYNPTNRLRPMRRRTIQHAKRGEELRILICIHNQDNVPSLINILEASNATEYSPLAVIGVILVELIGRIAPQLIAHHHSDRAIEATGSGSSNIVNALHSFETHNHGHVHVQAYTSVSHFETMDDDVCRLALDQNANIVIVPFHKSWGIDGNVGHVNRNIQAFNLKVMEKVPCSVGVLVDRETIKGSYTINNTNPVYHVAVIYIGGVDDIESVCYGSRMATHENVTVTVFRFLLFGCDTARERKFDNNLIDEIRQINAGNHRFMYEEEVVRDGVELASSLRRIKHGFDLIIVGMHHPDSPLMKGLDAWSECEELGVIGDMLASPDIETTTSLLVVRQQRMQGKLASISWKPAVVDTQLHGVRRMSNMSSG